MRGHKTDLGERGADDACRQNGKRACVMIGRAGLGLWGQTCRYIAELGVTSNQGWDFFFVIGAALALLSLHRLVLVNEEGEIHKKELFIELRTNFKNRRRLKTKVIKAFVSNLLSFLTKGKNKKQVVSSLAFDESIKEVA